MVNNASWVPAGEEAPHLTWPSASSNISGSKLCCPIWFQRQKSHDALQPPRLGRDQLIRHEHHISRHGLIWHRGEPRIKVSQQDFHLCECQTSKSCQYVGRQMQDLFSVLTACQRNLCRRWRRQRTDASSPGFRTLQATGQDQRCQGAGTPPGLFDAWNMPGS
jgi:hypothetical protein